MKTHMMSFLRPVMSVFLAVFVACSATSAYADLYYVKPNGPGPDGKSWATAFGGLQAAIYAGKDSQKANEIWVAAGTYGGSIYLDYYTRNNPIALYGGFNGTETEREQRDWKNNKTILDGTSSYTIVKIDNNRTDNIVDGFTIQNCAGYNAGHGGIVCQMSSELLDGPHPGCTIANNTFLNNSGDAIFLLEPSSIYISNNIFSGNDRAINCIGDAVHSNVTIIGNKIMNNVTGIFISSTNAMIRNNVIAKNSDVGISCSSGRPTILGNTIADNTRAGILCGSYGATIKDCILWGNGKQFKLELYCVPFVNYSDIQGGWQALMSRVPNLNVDPLFADPANGDYHLKSQTGRWTAAGWVKDDVTSPCIDVGDPSSDYSMEPHPNGGRANMGAYGNTAQASLSQSMFFSRCAKMAHAVGEKKKGSELGFAGELATLDFWYAKPGLNGCPVYGPYNRMQAGNYKVTFSIAVETLPQDDNTVIGFLDAVADGSKVKLLPADQFPDGRKYLKKADFPKGAKALQDFILPFSLSAATELVEFRISTNGTVGVICDSIEAE